MAMTKLRVIDSGEDASDAVLESALRLQLNGSWGEWGPCKIGITPRDMQCAHYQIITHTGWAVTFEVFGVRFGSFRDSFTAEKFMSILRQHGYYTEPSTPNSDRSQVYLWSPPSTVEE